MKKVTIYSTQNCKYCKDAKVFFDENNISYVSLDVGTDPEAKADMVEKSNQMGVPVIIIGDDIVVGFNKPVIKKLLSLE